MLTKPDFGWTNIVIGNNVLPASYKEINKQITT